MSQENSIVFAGGSKTGPSGADPNQRNRGGRYLAGLVAAVQNRVALATAKATGTDRPVLAVEYLITASPEFFRNSDKGTVDAYFDNAKAWLREKHGADNVVSITRHNDEKTPHLSAFVAPPWPGMGRPPASGRSSSPGCRREPGPGNPRVPGGWGLLMNRMGYDEGAGVGYSEAKDEKAAAAWANTPQGRQAHEPAKSADIDALAKCNRPGWHIKTGVCIVGPTSDKETYGWSVP